MWRVLRMVAVPVPRFLKRYLARGLVQLFLAGLVGLRSCLFTVLVARRARCTSVLWLLAVLVCQQGLTILPSRRPGSCRRTPLLER